MTCKNICVKLAAKGYKVKSPYQNGFRYCRRCEVYMKTEHNHCPCCGVHLRYTPFRPAAKAALRRGGNFKN